MSKEALQMMVDDLYQKFGIEMAACDVFERRWSYLVGTKGFISGTQRMTFDDAYGLILDCKEENLNEIKDYIKQSEGKWSNEKSCNY